MKVFLILINMLPSTFWSKVNKTDSCWEWNGYIRPDGYSKFEVNRKTEYAHRLSYEDVKGKIPHGLELDHLCRNRKCVNPDHLEAVTHKENMRRSLSGFLTGLKQRLKTHCPQRHEYTEKNTYVESNGGRHCRTCDRIRHLECKKTLTTFNMVHS